MTDKASARRKKKSRVKKVNSELFCEKCCMASGD